MASFTSYFKRWVASNSIQREMMIREALHHAQVVGVAGHFKVFDFSILSSVLNQADKDLALTHSIVSLYKAYEEGNYDVVSIFGSEKFKGVKFNYVDGELRWDPSDGVDWKDINISKVFNKKKYEEFEKVSDEDVKQATESLNQMEEAYKTISEVGKNLNDITDDPWEDEVDYYSDQDEDPEWVIWKMEDIIIQWFDPITQPLVDLKNKTTITEVVNFLNRCIKYIEEAYDKIRDSIEHVTPVRYPFFYKHTDWNNWEGETKRALRDAVDKVYQEEKKIRDYWGEQQTKFKKTAAYKKSQYTGTGSKGSGETAKDSIYEEILKKYKSMSAEERFMHEKAMWEAKAGS